MKIADLRQGDIVRFTTKVDKSSQNQPIQDVELRIEEITNTYIKGINVVRILDGTEDKLPYRTYKIDNIITGTMWVKIFNYQ